MCKLAILCVNLGVNFIFQKFCPCKKKDKYQVLSKRIVKKEIDCRREIFGQQRRRGMEMEKEEDIWRRKIS